MSSTNFWQQTEQGTKHKTNRQMRKNLISQSQLDKVDLVLFMNLK